MSISTPYHFVPLSEHIVLPDWADRVTQDIPFSDGMDGEFEIRITAQSEIYVRNGHAKKIKDGEQPDTSFFQAPDGRYCIPGTSVKGMFRNVLEIASFSRMRRISDRRYAIRDLTLDAYCSKLREVQAGFLDISSDDWKIVPCSWATWLRPAIDPDFGNNRGPARQKYVDFLSRYGSLRWNATVSDGEAKILLNGEHAEKEHTGVLVFTGQPQEAQEGQKDVKRREFFFYDIREGEAFFVDDESTTYTDEYGETVRRNQKDFKFIHGEDDEKVNSTKDFSDWQKDRQLIDVRRKYFGGRIPVFYVRDGGHLRFGLARMFRFAGEVSTVEALRNSNPEHYPLDDTFRPDMADLIFGYVTPSRSLRGRVGFSACFAEGNVEPLPEREVILATPKPSFFPAYLQQDNDLSDREKYKTFLDKDARLRGWKRYPALIPEGNAQVDTGMKQESDKVFSCFRPLPKGTVFAGRVRYHNLRKVELGALLWSIRLGSQEHHWHSLGMGKPYGMGKVKVEIVGMDDGEQRCLCKAFMEFMTGYLGEKFVNTPQIQALQDMMAANGEFHRAKWIFGYMTPKECRECKGNKLKRIPPEVLLPYCIERLKDSRPLSEPARAKPSAPVSPNAGILEKIKADRNNGIKVLKYLRGMTSAKPEEITEIERAIKPTNWYKSRHDPNRTSVEAELARLRASQDASDAPADSGK